MRRVGVMNKVCFDGVFFIDDKPQSPHLSVVTVKDAAIARLRGVEHDSMIAVIVPIRLEMT